CAADRRLRQLPQLPFDCRVSAGAAAKLRSWLVGLLVTSPLYYWLASRDSAYRRRQRSAQLAMQ
ncbi:hypothetical protein M2D63_007235, partial [Pseudomonas sp. BJa5]|uniref:hypothetical protein n=1 Tax=Pseudomonas sp. BJa5 TaxID=2936270 RepID=UPI0025597AB2